ncbi:glycosyltransferase, partial [Candidatus Parcubacteria bacterium]|nr:glycosyltransferase [Candidatus Parcubacteria bacterium]
MKVALINNFPPRSGTGRVPYSLWEEFKKIPEVAADLICTHLMSWEDYRDPKNQGVKVLHPFPYKEHEYLSRLMIYFWDPLRLPRGYDVYHITNHMLGRLGRFRRPVVVTAHDVLQFKYREDMGNPVVSKIYNYFMDQSIKSLRRVDRIICVSDHSRSQVIKQLGVSGERVVTVHNGLDHQLFRPLDQRAARQKLSLPPRAKVLLHVGSELRR